MQAQSQPALDRRLFLQLLPSLGRTGSSAIQCRFSNNEVDQVDLPMDFDLSLTITPTAANVDGWANIIHVTSTGNNCCEYGGHSGIWFHPNTKRL